MHYSEETSRNYEGLDSFVIYVCLEGGFDLNYGDATLQVKMGDAVLLPASITSVTLTPHGEFKALESYVPVG